METVNIQLDLAAMRKVIPNDGWVYCVGPMLRDRLEAEVKVAVKNKAPGFKPWHTVPLYNEAGEFIPLEQRL